jgi:hypothetical protein
MRSRLGPACSAAVAALTFLLLLPAVASAALPPQGLYEECAPSNGAQCASELHQIGSAGFRLALNYTAWYGSAADLHAYAAEAQAAGVQLIWPLNYAGWRDPGSADTLPAEYPALASSCGCDNNATFLQYVVGLVRSLPATWGFYIGDELNPSTVPQVAALAAQLRALDPIHPLLYVGQSFPSLANNLQPFASSADVIGADVYPVGEGVPTTIVGNVATTLAGVARAASRRPAMVLQAFSWAEYPTEINAPNARWPTEAEMRTMRDDALLANPSMILWYNLSDIQRSDQPAQHWHDLVTAAFAPAATAGVAPKPKTSAAAARAPHRRPRKPRRRHRHTPAHKRHRAHRARAKAASSHARTGRRRTRAFRFVFAVVSWW